MLARGREIRGPMLVKLGLGSGGQDLELHGSAVSPKKVSCTGARWGCIARDIFGTLVPERPKPALALFPKHCWAFGDLTAVLGCPDYSPDLQPPTSHTTSTPSRA